MKLGIISGWDEEGFERVRYYGLDYSEFTANHDVNSKDLLDDKENIKARMKKYNVRVGSAGRWGMVRIDDAGKPIPEAVRHDKNLIDLCSDIGCPVYNLGVNKAEKLSSDDLYDAATDYLGQLCDYAAGKGVKLGVYNCDWANFITSPEQWRVILPRIPALGIKYDPSHSINHNGGKELYLSEMAEYGDRIVHFHLKGEVYIDGKHFDEPPVGMDMIRWGKVFDVLYAKNYNGMCSLEPHSPKWTGLKASWGVHFAINFIKPFIMPEDYSGRNSPNCYNP